MIVSAAIVAKGGRVFCSPSLPYEVKFDISKHANNFLYVFSKEDNDVEQLPYIENKNLRYIYKQTDDLYWLLVTKTESDASTDIHILGKFVITIMEYGASETNSNTLTDEQRDLYYRHVWRPWDDGSCCPLCNSNISPETWEQEFEARLQFLTAIRNGQVDEGDAKYFGGLVSEAWSISAKLTPKWRNLNDNDGFTDSSDCSSESQSISEDIVIDGCRLKCRLEDLKLEIGRLQDPYLRLFARRDLLVGTDIMTEPLSSAPAFKDLSFDSCEI